MFVKKMISAEERLALYDKLISLHSGMKRKGATVPYTSINGNMYSYLSKDGFLALRLPEKMREDFLKKYKTTLVTAYGIVQKEYVTVPDSLMQATSELNQYFLGSVEYATNMKTKPTKKSKKIN